VNLNATFKILAVDKKNFFVAINLALNARLFTDFLFKKKEIIPF